MLSTECGTYQALSACFHVCEMNLTRCMTRRFVVYPQIFKFSKLYQDWSKKIVGIYILQIPKHFHTYLFSLFSIEVSSAALLSTYRWRDYLRLCKGAWLHMKRKCKVQNPNVGLLTLGPEHFLLWPHHDSYGEELRKDLHKPHM